MKKIKLFINSILCFFSMKNAFIVNMQISSSLFNNYNQYMDQWLSPNNISYNNRLLSLNCYKQCLKEFYNRLYFINTLYFSIWGNNYVQTILNLLNQQSDLNASRVVLTDDLYFYQLTLAGQENLFFDNLQISSLLVGIPVYIVVKSKDKACSYVVTPNFIVWIMHSFGFGLALILKDFMCEWSKADTIHTRTSIIDKNEHFQFYACVSLVFPLIKNVISYIIILISKTRKNSFLAILTVNIGKKSMLQMPFLAIPHSTSTIITPFSNRVYWWWNGLNFYNNYSRKLQISYASLAMLLSCDAFNRIATVKIVSISLSSSEQKLKFLIKIGHLLMTIVYIKWCIMLHFSRHLTVLTKKLTTVIYQNVYRLSRPNRERKSVISKSVLFHLLHKCPEYLSINSLTNKKYPQVPFPDEWNFLPETSLFELKPLVHQAYISSDFQNY